MTSIITIESNRRFSKAISAAIVCGAFLFGSVVATAQTPPISGVGTAVINGTLSEGEWDGAGTLNFDINLPEGGTTQGTLYIMNDVDNLYMALTFARTGIDPGNGFSMEFDNDGSGNFSGGDDGFTVNPASANPYFDIYRISGGGSGTDTDDGGTNDGAGTLGNNGFINVYEVSKPLDSADDAHDFSLTAGDTIEYFVFVRIFDGVTCCTDTSFPAFGVFTESLQIAEAGASRVLDFEPLAHDGTFVSVLSPYHEDGFTITSVSGGTPQFTVFGPEDPRYTGSAALAIGTVPATHTLTNDNNDPFTLVSIDVSEWQIEGGFGSGLLTYTGIKTNETMVMHSFLLDQDFGPETIVFPPTFSNLESVSVFISADGTQYNQIDNVVLQTQSIDAVPEAVDDFATTVCGVDENIFVLGNDEMLFDAPFAVIAQTTTDKGGSTMVNESPNSDPSEIFVTYTPPPGFGGTPGFGGIDTFSYTVTDFNGDSGTATVTVEVDGSSCRIEPGNDQIIFNPDPDSDLPVIAVVQEVVKAGTITQSSCVIEDDRGTAEEELDLVLKIKDTQDCIDKGVAAKLDPTIDKARLRTYQRAFDDNKIVVTLIRSKNTSGDPDDLTKGVVISEGNATKQLVANPDCAVKDVSDSPSTVGINLSFIEPSGDKARNWTGTCNLARDFGHFSDHLLAFPIRNVSAFLPPIAQANQEAGAFRDAVIAEQEAECVDSANKGKFLRNLLGSFNAAWRLVGRKKFDEAIDGLIETTLIALAADIPDPYGSCPNDPKGRFASRLMDLTYQVHRGLLHPGPDDDFVQFFIDQRILDELPPFPTDAPPIP